MRKVAAAVAIYTMLAFAVPFSGASQTPESVLEKFGYLGHWAPDCSRKAQPGNSHMRVSVAPSGGVVARNSLGESYQDNVNDILDAKLLSKDRLWIRTLLNGEQEREWEVVREADRIRTVLNRKPDGSYITKDGIVLSSGNPTPWLSRCR